MSCPCCRSRLFDAATANSAAQATVCDTCLPNGDKIPSKTPILHPLKKGIHSAAAVGDLERVQHLLHKYSNKRQHLLDDFGVSPFHTAAQGDHAHIVRYLISSGIDPDLSGYGATALHRASWWGSVQVVKAIVESGCANINARDTSFGDMQTPLMKAAGANNVEIVDVLLEHGARKDLKSSNGMTAGKIAAAAGSWESLQRLLEAGSDALTDVIDTAVAYGQPEIVRCLLTGFDLESKETSENLIAKSESKRKELQNEHEVSMKASRIADARSYINFVNRKISLTSTRSSNLNDSSILAKKKVGRLTGNLSRYRQIDR